MKKTFASPKVCKWIIILNSISMVFLLYVCIMFKEDFWIPLISGGAFFCVPYFSKRNAFIRFWADEEGLHNKYLHLKWEDISTYELFGVTYDLNLTKKISCPSVICFGKPNNKKFWKQNPKECVFISIIPSHMQLLEKYGKGKSKAIDEILQRYYVTGNAEDGSAS